MKQSRRFANRPDSVRASRRFVRQCLVDASAGVSDAVELMTSELTTNCIRHAAAAFTLSIEVTSREVRVEVADAGSGLPSVRTPGPMDPSGRGLRIVETLSDDWGVRPATAERGKAVWFTHALVIHADS